MKAARRTPSPVVGRLTRDHIDRILQRENVGRIGMSHNGHIYIVPINYIYEDDSIYGYTTEGVKIHMMRANPEVCFEVDHAANVDEWESVIAWGTYEELKDDSARKALQKICGHLSPVRGIHGLTGSLRRQKFMPVIYRVRLKKFSGRFKRARMDSPSIPMIF